MAAIAKMITIAVALALAGCAGIIRHTPSLGDPEPVVIQKMGRPNAVYPEGAGRELEFTLQPMGQFAYMAHIGPDGRLVKFEQVLTGQKFATVQIDKWTKADILRTFGHPAETSYLPLRDLEVWSYRYKEADVWNSLMNVHFDRNGIVRQMLNSPDPLFERRDGFSR